MKVALLTDQFVHTKDTYVVCGWVQSLILTMQRSKMIELAVIGLTEERSSVEVEKENNITFYKVNYRISPNFFRRIYKRFKCEVQNDLIVKDYVNAIQDFNPDIIQIFGAENFLCSVLSYVTIPAIIHLQGLVNAYLDVYFPPGISVETFSFYSFNCFRFLRGWGAMQQYNIFRMRAKKEQEYFQSIRFVMGRTDWDKKVAGVLAKNVCYFHVEEVLRPDFYTDRQWHVKNRNEFRFISILSPSTYKGFDLILKTTAHLISKGVKFQWIVCGTSENDDVVVGMEKIFRKKFKEQNVLFLGKKTSADLVSLLLDADIFIHPSYIENSPNSICEAQILGLPVIATYVGGVSSLIHDNETGILIPAGDSYYLAGVISLLLSDNEKMQYLGANARKVARERHDRETILRNVESVYQKILRRNIK